MKRWAAIILIVAMVLSMTACHTHNFSEANCTTPKTCTGCGMTEGNANGHKWKSATCTVAKTCKICGTTEGDPAAHNYSSGICKNCGVSDPTYYDSTNIYARLVDYITENGKYSSSDKQYIMTFGVDEDGYKRVGYYKPSSKQVMLALWHNETYVYFTIDSKLDGIYRWSYSDSNGLMSGTLYASTYAINSQLSYDYATFEYSMFTALARTSASLMMSVLCLYLNSDLASIDVSASDLGFQNY